MSPSRPSPTSPPVPTVLNSNVSVAASRGEPNPSLPRGASVATLLSCNVAKSSCTVHVSGLGPMTVSTMRVLPPPNVGAVTADAHSSSSAAEPEAESTPSAGGDEVEQGLREEVARLTLRCSETVSEKDELEGRVAEVEAERDEVVGQLEVRTN